MVSDNGKMHCNKKVYQFLGIDDFRTPLLQAISVDHPVFSAPTGRYTSSGVRDPSFSPERADLTP